MSNCLDNDKINACFGFPNAWYNPPETIGTPTMKNE